MSATVITVLLVLLTVVNCVQSLSSFLNRGDSGGGQANDSPDPLFLTPLIQGDQVAQARISSRVHGESLGMDLESYSGFLTVRPQDEAHLFFWFFPALNNAATAPVVLWLNGGPGLTSLSGLFAEIGPYYVTDDGKAAKMDVTWISKFNVIFLDAPVGAGFSFPSSDKSYSQNSEDIAKDIQEALRQFFIVFIDYAELDFYAAGESYAGKYVVSLANAVTTAPSSSPIKLKGIIVAGLYDPINELMAADYLLQLGLIQQTSHDVILNVMTQIATFINAGQYVDASKLLAALNSNPSFFTDDSGIKSSNNVLLDAEPSKYHTFFPFVDTQQVRRALHAGDVTPFSNTSSTVISVLIASGDIANSMKSQLEVTLNAGDIKVLFVTGNMDYRIVPIGAENAAQALQWKCQTDYSQATRKIWQVNADDVNSAGYVKCACNFCRALVRDAGQRLAGDQPVRALDLVDRFINNKPY